MSNVDKRALYEALQADAGRLGISVQELVRRITSGAHVVGGGSGVPVRGAEIFAPPIHMSTGEGHMPQIEEPGDPDADDIDDLADRRARALAACDGDDLAAEEMLQTERRRSITAQATVSGNPASALKNMMGSTATVRSGATPTDAPTVALWNADSDAESRAVGVTFSMLPVSIQFGAFDVKPFGVVRWGCRGVSALAEVDIGTGCRFAVEGSQVSLQVGVDAAVAPANPCSLIMSGMLSFSPVMRPTPITRTVYIESVAPSSTTAGTPIKPFAKSVSFWRAALSTGPIVLHFRNSALQDLYTVSIAANAVLTDPVPLANDVTQIAVENQDGINTLQHARLIFNLSF
jgi:hypothetical protein